MQEKSTGVPSYPSLVWTEEELDGLRPILPLKILRAIWETYALQETEVDLLKHFLKRCVMVIAVLEGIEHSSDG